MLTQIRRYIRLSFVLLLPAYFLILTNSVQNKHTHILPNGIVITHSHPLPLNANGEKDTHHHHSKKSLIFLHYFSIGFYVISDHTPDFHPYEYQLEIRTIIPRFLAHQIYVDGISQRAPPVLS